MFVTFFLAVSALAQGVDTASVSRLTAGSDTATYQSPALRAVITEAAAFNRRVPAGLGSYRAQMESEISIGNQRPDKGERAVSVEQVASELTWTRVGAFEQRITGYRSQSMGPQFASIGFFRNAWAVPSLYGNRLALLFGRDSTRRRPSMGRARAERSTVYAVHPLAEDRERIYRFRGGDTVQVLRVGERTIPIIRVDVEPKEDVPDATVIFTGEVDLDASRKHIVRMRGYFARVGGKKPKFDLLSQARLQGIAFVELLNNEIEQAYWLPSYQRFEAQATAPFIGDARAVFRIVSRFRRYEITAPNGVVTTDVINADTLQLLEHRLSFAPIDSMNGFTDWRAEMGSLSSSVAATDFDDVAPDVWRTTGPPRLSIRPERVYDVAHVNRIEGIWTGLGVTRRFRDQAPGLTLRAVAGYAWNERTVRGRAIGEYNRARMRYAVRAGRSLDLTNDFRVAYDSGNATAAIFGIDDYDYVDRQSVMFTAGRLLPDRFGSMVRFDVGFVDDHAATNSIHRALIGRREFLPNRGVLEGRYTRTALTLDWRPDISGEMMRTGYGARLYVERGAGTGIQYQRIEARGATRWNRGRVTLAGRADVGAVYGRMIPPQQLFEIGSSEALPGYEYKEFAGNRAALVRGIAMYRFNTWTAPFRISRRLWLPGPSPALAFGIQAGWTDVSTGAARGAMLALGPVLDPNSLGLSGPVSRATDGIRATVSGGVRFFGGSVGILLARPVDHDSPWRLVLVFGQIR